MTASDSDSDLAQTYRGPSIPRPVGERLRTAMGLDERPTHFVDWVQAWISIADRDGIAMNLDALCTTDDSPHEARFNGRTQHYQCVQDPIIAPFISDDVEEVEVETRTPVNGDTVTLTVTESGIDADPEGTVFSFGVAADVETPNDDGPSPILAYGQFCPYGHAFSSRAEYEEWAAEVDGYTMITSMEDVFELSRAIGRFVR